LDLEAVRQLELIQFTFQRQLGQDLPLLEGDPERQQFLVNRLLEGPGRPPHEADDAFLEIMLQHGLPPDLIAL